MVESEILRLTEVASSILPFLPPCIEAAPDVVVTFELTLTDGAPLVTTDEPAWTDEAPTPALPDIDAAVPTAETLREGVMDPLDDVLTETLGAPLDDDIPSKILPPGFPIASHSKVGNL